MSKASKATSHSKPEDQNAKKGLAATPAPFIIFILFQIPLHMTTQQNAVTFWAQGATNTQNVAARQRVCAITPGHEIRIPLSFAQAPVKLWVNLQKGAL